jgi:hypothetical protein
MSQLSKSSPSNLAHRPAHRSDLTTRFSQLVQAHILDPGADLISRRLIRNRKDAVELGAKSLSIGLLLASALVAPEFLGIGLGGKITLALWGSFISWIGDRWKQDVESQQRTIEVATTARALHRGEVIDAIAFSQAETLRNALPYRQVSDDRLPTIAETLSIALEAIEGLEARIDGLPESSALSPARFNWTQIRTKPDKFPHFLLLAATGDGKTYLGEWLADFLGEGNDLKIVTTKRRRDQWRGMNVIGNGRNFEAIESELQQLMGELGYRSGHLDDVESMPQMIRVIDELPAIAENVAGEKDVKGKLKGLSTYTKPLILEARECRIRMVFLAQGKQVRLLGFEGISDCLDNLTIIRLGSMAIDHAATLLKNNRIAESDYQWLKERPYPILVGDELAEYPRPDSWYPTNRYVAASNSDSDRHLDSIFGSFPDSSPTDSGEDRPSARADLQPESEDSGKSDGKWGKDDFTRISALLNTPPDSPIFPTLDREGRLFTLRVMLFLNKGIQEIVRLGWGYHSGGKNYHLYQSAREMLNQMFEELNEQGFSRKNNWGFDAP